MCSVTEHRTGMQRNTQDVYRLAVARCRGLENMLPAAIHAAACC